MALEEIIANKTDRKTEFRASAIGDVHELDSLIQNIPKDQLIQAKKKVKTEAISWL